MPIGALLANGICRLDLSRKVDAWVLKAGVVSQNAHWGSSVKRVFVGSIFLAKSRLGLQKQVLSVRMLSGALWQRVYGG